MGGIADLMVSEMCLLLALHSQFTARSPRGGTKGAKLCGNLCAAYACNLPRC